MSLSAREENAKTLAAVFGLDEDDAGELLAMTVGVRAAPDPRAQTIRRHLVEMLARTGVEVDESGSSAIKVEVVIGSIAPSAGVPAVQIGVTSDEVVVSCEATPDHDGGADVPSIVLLIAACYAAGMAVRLGLAAAFSLPSQNTIRLPIDLLLGGQRAAFNGPVQLGSMYLAGAGAIGNGFLWALATMDVHGEIHVVDPKNVSDGNLGRCVWLEAGDVGKPKAAQLVSRAQPSMPGIKLLARVGAIQDLAERGAGPWLERLVVVVDSRRARRRLQEELPRDVFDASTTGIEEVVVHFNSARDAGACLSCIYHEDAAEAAHEQHVAGMLGVDVGDVKQHYVSGSAARRIALRHPDLASERIEGLAYDTLFKTMCAAGQLGVDEGRTVLAPLSFVSVLAGAYLALEVACRTSAGSVALPFNYWRASPWTSPVFALRSTRPPRDDCEACGNDAIRATVHALWGRDGEEPA